MTGTVNVMTPSIASLLVRSTGRNLADPTAPPLVLSKAATAIIVAHENQQFLVTAGHVVTGRHSVTGQPLGLGGTPRQLSVRLPHSSLWTSHYWISLPLWSADDEPLWLQHPTGPVIDVAAIPIPPEIRFCDKNGVEQPDVFGIEGIILPGLPWQIDVPLGPISLDVTDELKVVGYPFGVTGGAGLAIWTHGHIATELKFDHDGLPMYLIDAPTREGQSGAPVVFFSRSGQFPVSDGIGASLGPNLLRYMGLYSGRVDEHLDLGRVFRTSAVLEVLTSGVPPALVDD